MQEATATADTDHDPVDYARPTVAAVRAALAQLQQLRQDDRPATWRPTGRHHTRAGMTKRHGLGTPTEYALGDSVKTKRKLAAAPQGHPRRRNRKKRA